MTIPYLFNCASRKVELERRDVHVRQNETRAYRSRRIWAAPLSLD
jgi:hypothetical protein